MGYGICGGLERLSLDVDRWIHDKMHGFLCWTHWVVGIGIKCIAFVRKLVMTAITYGFIGNH